MIYPQEYLEEEKDIENIHININRNDMRTDKLN